MQRRQEACKEGIIRKACMQRNACGMHLALDVELGEDLAQPLPPRLAHELVALALLPMRRGECVKGVLAAT